MKKQFYLFIGIFSLFSTLSKAQTDTSSWDSLRTLELHISGQAFEMIHNPDESVRLSSTFFMIKNLVKAFKIKGSFDYPFDSVKAISILTPPDRKFRIMSWHLTLGNGTSHQYGVIQLNPEMLSKKQKKNKELKLVFPLIDRSDSIKDPEQDISTCDKWFGAHYYSIIPFNFKKKTYYILLGMDEWDRSANRKVIEILSFDKNNKPVFGGDVFKWNDGMIRNRKIFIYDNGATMTLRYLPEKQFVVFSHLIPKDGESLDLIKTYVPDGSFDYLKFEYGAWKQYEKLQDFFINTK